MSIQLSTGAWAAWLCTNSLQDIFANAVIDIFSGSQPSNPDAVETGDKIATLSVGGLTFTPGVSTNGLNFADTTDATLSKEAAEDWEGDYILAGRMGWFRLYANDKTTGASTTAIRIDGNVGTSSRSDAEVVTTTATIGGSAKMTSFKLNFSLI